MSPRLPRRPADRSGLRLWNVGLVLVLAFAAAALVATAVFYTSWDLLEIRKVGPEHTIGSKTLFDLVKLSFGVVAGAGALVALVVAYRRQRVDEDGAVRDATRLHTERFTAAVAQLGDISPAVRLGGVHALAGLADDAPTRALRQTCIDVLCAYLRLPYIAESDLPRPRRPGSRVDTAVAARDAQHSYLALREVRHTVIRIFRDHLRLPAADAHSWQGYDFDLNHVTFDGGDFSGAVFSGGTIDFSCATFSAGDVSFRGSTFSGGTIDFSSATFSAGEVAFDSSTFSGNVAVAFGDATFAGGTVSFSSATFSGGVVHFSSATFSAGAVYFHSSTFTGGSIAFNSSTFSGCELTFSGTFSGGMVTFGGSTFSGGAVSFRYVTFSAGAVDFYMASFSSSAAVHFTETTFSGGMVTFGGSTFSGGAVSFAGSTFSGGRVHFDTAMLATAVRVEQATFTGGVVDFSLASGTAPLRRELVTAPPDGLLLPAGWGSPP